MSISQKNIACGAISLFKHYIIVGVVNAGFRKNQLFRWKIFHEKKKFFYKNYFFLKYSSSASKRGVGDENRPLGHGDRPLASWANIGKSRKSSIPWAAYHQNINIVSKPCPKVSTNSVHSFSPRLLVASIWWSAPAKFRGR